MIYTKIKNIERYLGQNETLHKNSTFCFFSFKNYLLGT